MPDSKTFPFPFIGAGEAQYFEWAEVHVLFERKPTKSEQRAISKTVPPPLTHSVSFEGEFLLVASDQFAHVVIAETYEPNENDFEQDGGSHFFARQDQVRAFNADTDRWLMATHEISPILVAFRTQHGAAGGTELSDWHAWSVAQSDQILEKLNPAIAESAHPGNDLLLSLIDVFEFEGRALPDLPYLREVTDPGSAEWELANVGAVDDLVTALKARDSSDLEPALENIVERLDPQNANHRLAAGRLVTFLASMKEPFVGPLAACAEVILAGPDPDDLLTTACEAAARADGLLGFLVVAAKQMSQKRWDAAARVFDRLLRYEGIDPSTYQNALLSILAFNTGTDVQPERGRRYIEAALPYADGYPVIHYCIACVEMELGNEAAVLEHCRSAVEHGYRRPEEIQQDSIFGDLREDPRFQAIFD